MTPEPTHWYRYKDRSILVFDNVFDQETIEAFSVWMQKLPYELRPSFDNELSAQIEAEMFHRLPELPDLLPKLIDKYYPQMCKEQSPQQFSHFYAATMRYGDFTQLHLDIDCHDCISFFYYANIHWDALWGGETLFYDDDETEVIHAVTPKPGRLVMFNASLVHRGGVPMRDSISHRYGLSIFYRCEKKHDQFNKNQISN
jgi:hypothetical protein